MRKSNDQPIGEVLQQLLQTYHLKRKFDEQSIVQAWPELIGKSVAKHTQEILIRDAKLFLKVDSSVVKHQLLMMRGQIVQAINERAGTELVREVVLL
ncbi:MAG: DUF721 domain-containing protein [Mucilaginibacter polytrichastri]|nr:DUF721 domain-containing protein [Mucilaginibacter polytrichastri]